MTVLTASRNKKAFGTQEWASATFNNILGCSHNCLYCYSKAMAIRFKRCTSESWQNEVFTGNVYKSNKKHDGMIMYPSTHDITPSSISCAMSAIDDILATENNILIVSKPHYSCIQSICEEFYWAKKKIMFRFTIGSNNDEVLSFWEPGAPSYAERLSALKYSYESGFATSVSVEPILDCNTEDLINDIYDFISNSIWLGEVNFLTQRMSQNGVLNEESREMHDGLLKLSNSSYFEELYKKYKYNNKIFWKDSLKKRFGLSQNEKFGMDI